MVLRPLGAVKRSLLDGAENRCRLGGGVSAPTATVAGALLKPGREFCDSCFSVGSVARMIATTTAAAATAPTAIHNNVLRRRAKSRILPSGALIRSLYSRRRGAQRTCCSRTCSRPSGRLSSSSSGRTTFLTTTVTTIGRPHTLSDITQGLPSCLVTPSAGVYGSEDRLAARRQPTG